MAGIGGFGLKQKITALLFLPIILFLGLCFLYIIPSIRSDLQDQKMQQTKTMVEVGSSVIKHYYALEQSGEMNEAQAKTAALEAIKAIRYGDQGKDYFWISDQNATIIMHPIKPALDGTDGSAIKDKNGNAIFVEFAKVTKENGSGFVNYYWQYYSDTNRVEPKTSYVSLFEPWGWIVGTGIYTNDVNTIINQKIMRISIIIVLVIVISLIAVLFFINRIIRDLLLLINKMKHVASGDLNVRIDSDRKDEIGVLQGAINDTLQKLKDIISGIMGSSQVLGETNKEMEQIIENARNSMEDVVRASGEIAANAQENAQAVDAVTDNAVHMSENANVVAESVVHLEETVGRVNSITEQGRQGISEIVMAIHASADASSEVARVIESLEISSIKIGEATNLMSGIAAQTNLLALNAAIEAARAGESGRGFAVVADEVRQLAEQSAEGSKKISGVVAEITNSIRSSVEKAKLAGEKSDDAENMADAIEKSIVRILSEVQEISSEINNIAMISKREAAESSELARTMSSVSDRLSLTAASTQEISASTQEQTNIYNEINSIFASLTERINGLHAMVSQFKK